MKISILLPILVLAMLTSSISAGYTDEEVKWWLLANLPGVCAECPEVIAFYKERLDAMQQPQILPPRESNDPRIYEELILLNATHNLIIYHEVDSRGRPYTYNVTRWVTPPSPTPPIIPEPIVPITPTLHEQVQVLEARIEALEARVEVLEACTCHT